MTFRHPLRNEWDARRPAFAAMAEQPGRGGAIARAMLGLIPPFLDLIEAERDRATAPGDLFDACAAVAGAMIENAIDSRGGALGTTPRDALYRMLGAIERAVLPQITARKRSTIITPGGV
jgi:hypothetical protein